MSVILTVCANNLTKASGLTEWFLQVIVKDSNVVCVAEAVGCVGALAKGLRSNFSSQGR